MYKDKSMAVGTEHLDSVQEDCVIANSPGKVMGNLLCEIATTHQHVLEQVAYRITGDRENGRDAVAEVYTMLLKNPDVYEGRAAFKTFLYRMVINKCLDKRRQQKRRQNILDTWFEPPVDQETHDFDIHAFVRKKMADLPDHFRIPMVLADVEGMPYEEIAVIQKTTCGTIRTRIFRGREKLRKELQKAGYSL